MARMKPWDIPDTGMKPWEIPGPEEINVEAPNGLKVSFPAGTSETIINSVMGQASRESLVGPSKPTATPASGGQKDPRQMKFRVAGEPAQDPRAMKFRVLDKPPAQPELSWAEVPGEALRNAPKSAGEFAGNLTQAVMNPLDTLMAVGDLGAGAIRAGAQAVLPTSAFNYLDSVNPEAAQRAGRTASAVGDFYGDRYGSEDGLKRAIASDPVGVAADLSTLLTGGAGGARAALGAGSRTAQALNTASRLTNPLTPVIAAGEATAKAGGMAVGGLLGLTTGTSAGTIDEAYRAGLAGGKQQSAFLDNMRGAEDQTAVVVEARQALGQIAETRAAQYADDMRAVKADTKAIDFKPIERKFFEVVDSMYDGKHQVAADETIAKLDKIQNVLAEWSADPAMHTAGGLDALKRRIDNLMPSFADANAGNTERAVTAIRNVVKDEIVKAAPQYRDAMQNYESSKAAQREIVKSLSLGREAATDTALRKLQSLTRNGAGNNAARAKVAEALMKSGAETLMPRLAGQALNSKVPRGLMQTVAGAGLLGGAFLNPAFLAALPITSPRLEHRAVRLNLKSSQISSGVIQGKRR